jgi:hypothetical protein
VDNKLHNTNPVAWGQGELSRSLVALILGFEYYEARDFDLDGSAVRSETSDKPKLQGSAAPIRFPF